MYCSHDERVTPLTDEQKSEADTEKSTEERPSDQGAARVQSVVRKRMISCACSLN